jgi:hypothetical protein
VISNFVPITQNSLPVLDTGSAGNNQKERPVQVTLPQRWRGNIQMDGERIIKSE